MRYVLFAGSILIGPKGGWDDYVDSYIELDEAKAASNQFSPQSYWAHVVDLDCRKIVWSR